MTTQNNTMQETPKHPETSIWNKNIVTEPYQTFAQAFYYYPFPTFREIIKALVKSAYTNNQFIAYTPAKLIDYMDCLEMLINGAYLLNEEKKKSSLIIKEIDFLNKNLYCGSLSFFKEWDYFPRHLSKEEYKDPYIVFKKFFKYKKIEKWKQILSYLISYALDYRVLCEEEIRKSSLSIYLQLVKLLEAAHLIDVRETTHVCGRIKERV